MMVTVMLALKRGVWAITDGDSHACVEAWRLGRCGRIDWVPVTVMPASEEGGGLLYIAYLAVLGTNVRKQHAGETPSGVR